MTDNGLLNTLMIISCLVLATSYFLPVEREWAPVDAWLGYYSGEQFISGFNIGLVEVFPLGVGLIILLASQSMPVLRTKKECRSTLLCPALVHG